MLAAYNVIVTALTDESAALSRFIREHPRLVVLTGAGVSLDSGIPTYRDESGNWLPKPPIQERDFLQDVHTRKRYWTRSWHGWPTIRDAMPNPCHTALAMLETNEHIQLLITQNVDGLHQKAGSRLVVDLHGRVDQVRCLECDALHCRNAIQEQLNHSNTWPKPSAASVRPDGDMEVPDYLIDNIVLPHCPACGGEIRPDVVFFGGSVPIDRVQTCQQGLEQADALLVVGSSLTVFSGFRFCRRASQLNKPIGIINPGQTRADDLAHTRLYSPAGPLLTEVMRQLLPGPGDLSS